MPVNIHATEKPLAKIFSNDFAFSIPTYQRPYAWTTEQAGELLSDLRAFLSDGGGPIQDVNPYFLGSIVLIKKEDSPEADVVDGQQRLTTLTILLAAIRHAVPESYSDGITKYIYEQGNIIEGTPNRYRLRLRERDAEFFKKYIQDRDGFESLLALDRGRLTDSEANIFSNAQLFVTELEKLAEGERIRLLQYLITRCFLVAVTTPDMDSAYRIFSVLNARGLDLGLTDLLKSDIIGAIPPDLQGRYTQIWEDEEEDLGRDAFQELFTHIRMIFRKVKPKESILNEYLKLIKPREEPRKFIDEVLKPYSDAFEEIKTKNYFSDRDAESINALFRWLNQIDNVDWIPPAILYLSRNRNQPDDLKRFFTDLERLAAGLMIMRADINYRYDRYGRLLNEIEQGEDLFLADSALQLSPIECNEVIRNLNGNLYLAKRIRQFVLVRLDSALSDSEATYHYPVISVEHVLPQNPPAGSAWTQWFPSEEEREAYVHRLGNLVLLSRRKNSEAQNYDFARKKEKYFKSESGVSPFALTTQVLQEAEWTPEVVDRRQDELLQKLRIQWRL